MKLNVDLLPNYFVISSIINNNGHDKVDQVDPASSPAGGVSDDDAAGTICLNADASPLPPVEAALPTARALTAYVGLFGYLAHSRSVNGPQVSEETIIAHVAALEDIGYRTVGTHQARQGEVYVEEQVRGIAKRCEADGVLDCDVWIQTGDGFHE